MPFNRIAIFGHRGWASSAISHAIANSGAPTRVLYRPGSDVRDIPPGVDTVQVDLDDQSALQAALKDIDIVISLVGRDDVPHQHAFFRAIPHTAVKLFVPSDLSFRCDEQALRVPDNQAKADVERAAREAGIPTTVLVPGFFAESSLAISILGVDLSGNRIVYTGNSEHEKINLCTREYVAKSYASIFAATPLSQLQNRVIGLSELQVTGREIADALSTKHGAPPQVFRHSLDEVNRQMTECLRQGRPLAMSWLCRWTWGSGKCVESIGPDVWAVEGYRKKTLDELIVRGGLVPYKGVPDQLKAALDQTFY